MCNKPWDFIDSIATVHTDGLLCPDLHFKMISRDVHCGQKRSHEDSSSTASPSHALVPAHNFILIARSPVLRAMLRSDMREARTDSIKIMDFAVRVVQAFVRFLCSNACTK
jgi:hypothetical protein